jgi:hypothetical protein
MNWIWWLIAGFVVGLNVGVGLMALMQLSNRRRRERVHSSGIASALEGPSTIF